MIKGRQRNVISKVIVGISYLSLPDLVGTSPLNFDVLRCFEDVAGVACKYVPASATDG